MNAVIDAHRRSIIEICSKDYTPEQITKFSEVTYSSDIWKNSVNNDYHVLIEVNGVVEGMCHAGIRKDGNGEILGLYFTKKIAGKGIGREVVEMAFNYLEQFNPPKIVLTGTITAKPFYEKMGFVVIGEEMSEIRGTQLQCFKMERVISC